MARVARALRGAREGRGELVAVPLPVGEAAREVDGVLVAELVERLRRERRAAAALAVDDEPAVLSGISASTATRGCCAARGRLREVALVPLLAQPDVDEQRLLAALEQGVRLRRRDLVDLGARACQELTVGRHY